MTVLSLLAFSLAALLHEPSHNTASSHVNHFVDRLRSTKHCENTKAAAALPAHSFHLASSYPAYAFQVDVEPAKKEYLSELLRHYFGSFFMMGFSARGSWKAEPSSYVVDSIKEIYDGKGNKSLHYQKSWTRIPLDEYAAVTGDQFAAITQLPFFELKGENWSIYFDEASLNQMQNNELSKGEIPAYSRNNEGGVEQSFILVSPKGEKIELKFHLSQKDASGREWVPAWSRYRGEEYSAQFPKKEK